MTNLSYAQIEQRRAAARSRWEKVGVAVGTGLLFGAGAHGASNLIRKKIAKTVSTKLASKVGEVETRTTASIVKRRKNRLATIDAMDDKAKKASKAKPEKVIADRLKQLELFQDRLQTHTDAINVPSEGNAAQSDAEAIRERRSFRHPITGIKWNINVLDAAEHYKGAQRERQHLKSVKLPYRGYRTSTVARPRGQPDAEPINPVRSSRPKITRGKMTPKEITDLRAVLYSGSSIKAARLRREVIRASMGERAKNHQQMENVHAKLKAYYSKRGYTRRKAAVVTGVSVLGGATAGYNLSNLQKADTSFADKIQQAFESLKAQTQQMIYNVANNLSPFDINEFQLKLKDALGPLTEYFLKGIAEGIASERPKYINVRFDLLQPVIFSHLDGTRAQLIVNLSEEQRNNITKAITEGLAAGHAPAKIARTIRPGIGLTDNQTKFVDNYRTDLILNKPQALGRALRDKRYDRTVAKAVKTGVPLTAEQVNSMTEAYGRRFLAFRANTIARDQSLAAVNLGHVSTIKEVASKHGLMVEKTWIATHDSHTREAHRELDGKTVTGIDTPFQSELGPIRYPYDPQASAADTIQCRCHMKFKLMPMNQIRDVTQ